MERSRDSGASPTTPTSYLADPPSSNAIIVVSGSAGPLVFDSQHGGASLNATYSYLPIDFKGSDAERQAMLVANAGKIVLAPGPLDTKRTSAS